MKRETLLLDRNWQMMKMIPWTDAVIDVYCNDKARIGQEYDHVVWSSKDGSQVIKKPRVIILKKFVLSKILNKCSIKRLPDRALLQRDGYKCQYCGKKISRDDFTKDHVLPQSRGGMTTSGNLVCCCFECNQKKANRTPEEADMMLLKPVVPVNMFDPTREMMQIYNNFLKKDSAI